jgi:hypothetical protein
MKNSHLKIFSFSDLFYTSSPEPDESIWKSGDSKRRAQDWYDLTDDSQDEESEDGDRRAEAEVITIDEDAELDLASDCEDKEFAKHSNGRPASPIVEWMYPIKVLPKPGPITTLQDIEMPIENPEIFEEGDANVRFFYQPCIFKPFESFVRLLINIAIALRFLILFW